MVEPGLRPGWADVHMEKPVRRPGSTYVNCMIQGELAAGHPAAKKPDRDGSGLVQSRTFRPNQKNRTGLACWRACSSSEQPALVATATAVLLAFTRLLASM